MEKMVVFGEVNGDSKLMHGIEGELERRTITYTEWNQSVSNMDKSSWHPMTFGYADAGPEQINRIKDTEYRREWCHYNSTRVPCFLFARKFSQGAAMRLLSEGVVSQFDVSALMDPTPSFSSVILLLMLHVYVSRKPNLLRVTGKKMIKTCDLNHKGDQNSKLEIEKSFDCI
ncbi:hypothetical protein T459_04465 [Capsicum annuum]|uniref:Uncharacterized protein n=1 Tax=Capsicum annuum TaxID=4072 RepID=A0A2G3A543_CAPAN|nr:hypothetical protein T459_04465 [Capsicum annuum]